MVRFIQLHVTHAPLAPRWDDAMPRLESAPIIPDVAAPEQAARIGRKTEIAGFRRCVRFANK